jgi:hypothetical protein
MQERVLSILAIVLLLKTKALSDRVGRVGRHLPLLSDSIANNAHAGGYGVVERTAD